MINPCEGASTIRKVLAVGKRTFMRAMLIFEGKFLDRIKKVDSKGFK